MKIDQIMLVLQDIKEENKKNINDNKNKINRLQNFLRQLENKIADLEKKEERLKHIKTFKKSKSKIIKMLLKPFEVGVIIALLISMVYLSEFISINLILACLCYFIAYDIVKAYYKEVIPTIDDTDDGLIHNYIEFFKSLARDNNLLNRDLNEIIDEKEKNLREYTKAERELSKLASDVSKMQDENDYIEGNEMGLNILDSKYQIKDVGDNLEITIFVNKKLERRNIN